MGEVIAMIQGIDGQFDIQFNNGRIVTEDILVSIVKHTIFCDGRVNSSLQKIRANKAGFIGDLVNNQGSFSTAWLFYKQSPGTVESRRLMEDEITQALSKNNYIINNVLNNNSINTKVDFVYIASSNELYADVKVYIGQRLFTFQL